MSASLLSDGLTATIVPLLPISTTSAAPKAGSSRNLVLCIDGTSNEFSIQNTNVVELYRLLEKDEEQLTYYTSGIGTFAHPHNTIFGHLKQRIETFLEMVTARHFERKIFNAYQWLSENYRPGDKIFLFGFSRGAYFVRVIAGMIERVGLLHKGNNDQIPFAFKLYLESASKGEKNMEKDIAILRQVLKPGPDISLGEKVGLNPGILITEGGRSSSKSGYAAKEASETIETDGAKVHFAPGTESGSANNKGEAQGETARPPPSFRRGLGSLRTPTIGSENEGNALGKDSNDDVETNPDILCARYKKAFSRPDVTVHFIGAWDTVSSIGLRRKPNLPETCTGMKHVGYFRHALALDERRVKFIPEYANGGAGPLLYEDNDSPSWYQRKVQEMWFRGCHADIGGSNNKSSNNDRPSLAWMISEARVQGLKVDDYVRGRDISTHHESLSGLWWVPEVLPLRRISNRFNTCERFTRWIHLGRSRTVQPGQMLHSSVLEAVGKKDLGYLPKAHLCIGPHIRKNRRHTRIPISKEIVELLIPAST